MTNNTNTENTESLFRTMWNTPGSTRGHLTFRRDGEVKFSGQEHGTLTLTNVRQVPGLGQVATLHEDGSSYWARRGERGYSAAQIHTVLLADEPLRRISALAVQWVANVPYVHLGYVQVPRNAADRMARSAATIRARWTDVDGD